MAKNAKESAQVKGRTTKLGKKSVEELIEIILRKDKTERTLSANVKNLKSEINALTTRVNNFDKDQEGNIQAIKDWREKYENKVDAYATLHEQYDNSLNELSTKSALYKDSVRDNAEINAKLNAYKKLCVVLAGLAVLCIGYICVC